MTYALTDPQKELVMAFMDLVPKMVTALTRSCTRLSQEEKEELEQTGYLALCRAAKSYDCTRPFETYAQVIIKHAIYDYWRKCKRYQDTFCSLDALSPSEDSGQTRLPVSTAHPEDTVLSREVSRLLIKLETQSGTIIQKGIAALLLQQYGYTSTDIAALYGVPANHIRAWRSKARKQLQDNETLYALLS